MFIAIERDEDKNYFAEFVHGALAYDPKKGILHIALKDRPTLHLPIGKFIPFVRFVAIDQISACNPADLTS